LHRRQSSSGRSSTTDSQTLEFLPYRLNTRKNACCPSISSGASSAHEHVVPMNDQTILHTVQQWRRKKYSARPFALTILAISLMTLLALAKDHYAQGAGTAAVSALGKRDLPVQNEEVRICPNTT
jgi:hypothetical protein